MAKYFHFISKIAFTHVTIVLLLASPGARADNVNWQTLLEQGDSNIDQQKLVQAESCYRAALKEIEHTQHNSDDNVKCLEKLASTLVLENKTDEALPLYYKSLHILEHQYGKKDPKIVPTLFTLGSVFESESDHKTAIAYYHRALNINEQHYGPHSLEVAENMHRLGQVNFKAGQKNEAEHQYKSSLAILMQNPSLSSSNQLESLLSDYTDLIGKDDSSNKQLISDFQTEILKDRLGFPIPTKSVPPSAWQKQITVLSNQAKNQQNDEEQKVLLRGFKQPFTDSTLEPAYRTMSDVLYSQHPFKQGEDYYQRMIAIDIAALGVNHPAVADDLTGLALLYISQHRYTDAKPILLRALTIYESVYGYENLLVTRTRSYLTLVYEKLGEPQQGITLSVDSIKKGNLFSRPNDLETARMLNELGFLYYSQGKLEDALTIYKWALATTKGAVGEQNILIAACLTDYANVLRSLGRSTEADLMYRQAQEIRIANASSLTDASHHD